MADTNELLKSKHGFGALENVDAAIANGKLDAYDILFVKDKNGKPYVGWVDKCGNKVIVEETEEVLVVEGESLPESGEYGKIYLFGEDGYFWNGEKFICLSKSVDLTSLENELAKKANAEEVDEKINQAISSANAYTDQKVEDAFGSVERLYEKVKYEVSHKPIGTLVDHRDKEIRIMCPSNTEWVLQQSGEGADANKYYIGFKAYAPKDVVSFKEDLAETINDDTMYYFEGNDFAGVDADGRQYSIVWLPVAEYDESSESWTYYGKKSSTEKYIGWYYSVEWYDANGVVIATDCIRINLSNEECHSSINPSYIMNVMATIDEKVENVLAEGKTYTDEQISTIIEAYTVVEF